MSIISWVKRMYTMLFTQQAEQDFRIETVKSPELDALIRRCADVYRGIPEWLSDDNDIRTIKFAKMGASETAKLVTLAVGIEITGSARAAWMQEKEKQIHSLLRSWVEFGCAYGTIIIKPNGDTFDVFTPLDYIVTECDNVGITGVIFRDTYMDGEKYYSRLEYHRFEPHRSDDGETVKAYRISNKCYVSKSSDDLGDPIEIDKTKWRGMLEDTGPILKANGESLDGPMFGVFRAPSANDVDHQRPDGLPIFADALEELKDLDVAYSRMTSEIFDSEKIVLMDDQLMYNSVGPNYKGPAPKRKLPHYVYNVFGNGTDTFYQEVNPQINTEARLAGIKHLISQIGYKMGFSAGYFVFDQHTGNVTATQIESDDQRTIQYIKDIRDKLQACLDQAFCALSVYADLYGLAPAGTYKINYDFGDITYNYEEDKSSWKYYVSQGWVPKWMYFVKFEGMSEEEAKALTEEAAPKETGLFGEE